MVDLMTWMGNCCLRREGRPSPDGPRGHWPSAAPATPYCVLMNDYWPSLGATGLVAVEGSFGTSPWFKILLTSHRA